jgi:hypothetical protein
LSYSRYGPQARDDVVTIPRIWITLILSLLVHGAAIYLWFPRTPLLTPGSESPSAPQPPLSVQLTPPRVASAAPLAQPREAPPPPKLQPRPPKPLVRPPPPAVTVTTPAPRVFVPPPTPPAPPAPAPPAIAPPPVEKVMSEYIAARKRARGEVGEATAPAPLDENARRDKAIADNLASMQSSLKSSDTFGNAPKNGGGTFQIKYMGYEDAEVAFFGWSKDVKRRIYQKIEIRRGDNRDINIAIVRKIISIIREHEPGDFRWDSKRLGREMMLSARPADNGALEEFMMQEFFTSARQPR